MPTKSSAFRVRLTVGLCLIIVGVGALLYFSRPVAQVVPVVRGLAQDLVPGSVTVDAEYQMDLKSEVGGRIVESALDDGKHVKKGEVLVKLDTADLEIEIEKFKIDQEAQEKRIKIDEQQAKTQNAATHEAFKNIERLHDLGQMSDNDFESQQRSLTAADQAYQLDQINNKNLLDSAANALKAKNRELDKMTITAWFDGVIEKVLARPGDLIAPGTPIAIIISTSRTVVARISEEDFAGIHIGQKASVRFLSYGNQLYNATVSKILPTADPETQRYEIFLNVDLPLEKLVPGLTGEVSIVRGEHEHALLVPRRALLGDHLYVVKDGRVELRKVTVGYVGLNVAEVTSGVEEGDNVIAEEIDRFRPGQHVRTKLLAE